MLAAPDEAGRRAVEVHSRPGKHPDTPWARHAPWTPPNQTARTADRPGADPQIEEAAEAAGDWPPGGRPPFPWTHRRPTTAGGGRVRVRAGVPRAARGMAARR
jgi:hypothetical protein